MSRIDIGVAAVPADQRDLVQRRRAMWLRSKEHPLPRAALQPQVSHRVLPDRTVRHRIEPLQNLQRVLTRPVADLIQRPARIKIQHHGAKPDLPAAVQKFGQRAQIMGGNAADADCATVTRGLACKVVGELVFGEHFVTQKSGDNVMFVPIQPLKAETTYVMVMTNNLRDNNGKAGAGSTTYELARQDINTLPVGSESQLVLQGAINSYESAVVAAGVEKDSIIYSAAMTTQSTTRVLSTVKAVMAKVTLPQMVANAQQGIPVVGVADTGLSVATVLGDAIPASLVPLYSAANYIRGSITLPYYSGVPSAENALAPVNDWWRARCDSGATLAGLAAANPSATLPTSGGQL